MKSRLSILPEAEAELVAAATWYESKRTGLGVEFIAAVDEVLDRIARAPREHPLWRGGKSYRRCAVTRFPFVVFFKDRRGSVEVVAFAHSKRRPGYWRHRGR